MGAEQKQPFEAWQDVITLDIQSAKMTDLIAAFKAAAKTSVDGNTVVVGNYKATKTGRTGTLFTGPAGWNIVEQAGPASLDGKKPSLKEWFRSLTLVSTDRKKTPEQFKDTAIEFMARQSAQKSYTEEDRKEDIRQALKAKLASLS